MEIVAYSEKYRDEMEFMLEGIQDFERGINQEREFGRNVAKRWMDEYSPEQNIEKIYLGVHKDAVIGFVWIYFAKDELNKIEYEYMYISDLFIKTLYRNRGFGKEFLFFCEKLGKQRKVKGSMLTVLAKNRNAYELYKSIGYDDLDITLYKKL